MDELDLPSHRSGYKIPHCPCVKVLMLGFHHQELIATLRTCDIVVRKSLGCWGQLKGDLGPKIIFIHFASWSNMSSLLWHMLPNEHLAYPPTRNPKEKVPWILDWNIQKCDSKQLPNKLFISSIFYSSEKSLIHHSWRCLHFLKYKSRRQTILSWTLPRFQNSV